MVRKYSAFEESTKVQSHSVRSIQCNIISIVETENISRVSSTQNKSPCDAYKAVVLLEQLDYDLTPQHISPHCASAGISRDLSGPIPQLPTQKTAFSTADLR
jgi:hypothetical protein